MGDQLVEQLNAVLNTLTPLRRAQGMPAPLTSPQRSQEMAAAAAGISVRSARRIDNNALQPKAGQPRGPPT